MSLPDALRYSLSDLMTWPETERMELIGGIPIMMSLPSREHQRILGLLHLRIGNYLSDKECEVYLSPFGVRLFEKENDTSDDVDTLVEPDITIICDPRKLDDIGCKGAPDMVVEILSPSTRRHDFMVKYHLYQAAGVREYWIVDPEKKQVYVYKLKNGKYGSHELYGAKTTIKVGVLENCYINLSEIF